MATVQKATPELFEQIYPLLRRFEDAPLSRKQWYDLLAIRWSSLHEHFGYVLLEQNEVVGFLGTLFFERTIRGVQHRFCDLFCWIVQEEYRRNSLLLLLPVLNLQNTTVMSLTPSEGAMLILQKFGFVPLETGTTIFTAATAFGRSRGIRLVTEPDLVRARLNRQELVLFCDHDLPGCDHLLLVEQGEEEHCYLVCNTVCKKHIRFSQVYHIGNRDLFGKGLAGLQRFFIRRHHTLFCLVDRRLLGKQRPGPAFDHTLRYPRLFKPAGGLQPEEVDNLYSELLLMRQ